MHINFTEDNTELSRLKITKFRRHGLNPLEFQFIKPEFQIDELLENEIKLAKWGLGPRFFLLLKFPMEEYFIKLKRIKLIDLMEMFFNKIKIGISTEISSRFFSDYSKFFNSNHIEEYEDLDLFVFYCLAFLFSHLGRYRINVWRKL